MSLLAISSSNSKVKCTKHPLEKHLYYFILGQKLEAEKDTLDIFLFEGSFTFLRGAPKGFLVLCMCREGILWYTDNMTAQFAKEKSVHTEMGWFKFWSEIPGFGDFFLILWVTIC